MRTRSLFFIATALVAVAACGGKSKGPKPLQHHLDDMHIARVSMSAKQDVVRAQNDYAVARMEHHKAQSDFEEVKTALKISKNERDQQVLAESSAESEKEAADRSNDMNRINRAARALRAAELERRAADEKVEYLKLRKKALEEYVRYTAEQQYAKEARFEYAKAKVARDNSIKPKGFDYNDYKRQAEDRHRRALEAKARYDQADSVASERRQSWQNLAREAQRARGGSTGTEASAP